MAVLSESEHARVTATTLRAMLNDGEGRSAGTAIVIDLPTSSQFRRGHIPGAWWAIRARLREELPRVPGTRAIVFTSTDGGLAKLAANDTGAFEQHDVRVLDGGTNA